MANRHIPSCYEKYWIMIRDHRWKRNEPNNPCNVVVLEAPLETHKKIVTAIRKRKWADQYKTGRDYGVLKAASVGEEIRFNLIPPEEETI